MDGASWQTGAGVGLLLKALTKERIDQAIQLDFPASNNEAQYEAILAGINLVISVSLLTDFYINKKRLILNIATRDYSIPSSNIKKLLRLNI